MKLGYQASTNQITAMILKAISSHQAVSFLVVI